jgi:hypothetical protein
MTGKFKEREAVRIIEGMEEFGNIEIVSYDTFRRKAGKKERLA